MQLENFYFHGQKQQARLKKERCQKERCQVSTLDKKYLRLPKEATYRLSKVET